MESAEKRKISKRNYYERNKERLKIERRERYYLEIEKEKEWNKNWAATNTEKRNQKSLRSRKKAISNLSDSYVRDIVASNFSIDRRDLEKYKDFISSYKEQLKIKRLINSKKSV